MQRREFMKTTSAAALAAALAPYAPVRAADRPVRVGIVGVGSRGTGLTRACLTVDNVEVKAVCDVNLAHLERAQKMCVDRGRPKPEGYSRGPEDYKRMCDRPDLDAVITATPWEWHVPVMLAALEAGKYGATEVPAAVTLDECWALVEMSEKTGIPCMMLENACYSRQFMACFNIIKAGLLGEIFHAESGYNHDVRYVKFETRPDEGTVGDLRWRGWHSVHRNGNLYPTHQFGPVALIMNINRGCKMDYLVSMSTPSRGINNYAAEMWGKDHPNAQRAFKNGDVNTTLIKLSNGNTVTQYHDTQSWRPRDDIHRYHGTRGVIHRTQNRIFTLDREWDGRQKNEWHWADLQPYLEEFDHPLWKTFAESASSHGHGGTDWMTMYGFIQACRNQTQTPLTVYDAASWSVISPLSEESVAGKSRPVDVPDFTKGMWRSNPPFDYKWQWT